MRTIPSILSSQNLTAFFTTRHGGVSVSPYDSGNLAFHVGDNAADVLVNHDLLAASAGYDRSRLIHMRQIHSDRIVIADETLTFDTPPECDALLTDRPDTPLMVMSADCTPILLHDPIRNVIGAIHAGRAGALAEILPKTIRMMIQTYGSVIGDIRISMGPSIHGCCYEINTAIAADVEAGGYYPALRFVQEKIYLDVNTILTLQLQQMGIEKDQVEVIESCTACESRTFFSYRADHQHTGRIAGVIMLRP